jgi:hypothetical protein
MPKYDTTLILVVFIQTAPFGKPEEINVYAHIHMHTHTHIMLQLPLVPVLLSGWLSGAISQHQYYFPGGLCQ